MCERIKGNENKNICDNKCIKGLYAWLIYPLALLYFSKKVRSPFHNVNNLGNEVFLFL